MPRVHGIPRTLHFCFYPEAAPPRGFPRISQSGPAPRAVRSQGPVSQSMVHAEAWASIARISTLQPAARSSGVAFSTSLWLMPSSQGTKTIAVGATLQI